VSINVRSSTLIWSGVNTDILASFRNIRPSSSDGKVVGQHVFAVLAGKPEQGDIELLQLVQFAARRGRTYATSSSP
jgi:hypothetical protein